MPRLQPLPGYVTAKEAAKRLNISDALLSRYVEKGKLHRYGPPERKHKFYKLSEIEALAVAERFFYAPGQWRNNPVLTFETATEADQPAMFEISRGTFDMPITPALVEIRREWMRKEHETYHVVRDQAGAVVAYACLPALPEQVIARFIRDEVEGEDITANDIQRFEPGAALHIYIMAMAVDPQCSQSQKHEYGAVLVRGLFAFLLDLAQRGVELETLTARTYKPDGLRMLRKLGIPQLHSPVPGKSLFAVRVPESGFPLFERYTELLREWQQTHQEALQTPVAISPSHTTPIRDKAALAPRRMRPMPLAEMPPGTLTLQEFADQLGIARRTLLELTTRHNFEHIAIPDPTRPKETKRYFTLEQQEAVKHWRAEHATKRP